VGAVLKDVTSSDSIKGYVVAAATAGIGEKFNLGYNPTELGFNAESVKAVALKTLVDSTIKTAVYGGSFKDNLGSSAAGAAVSIGGAVGANGIGDTGLADGSLSKIALHAALGGLMAEAMGGDFRSGAIAAGANEALVAFLGNKLLPKGVDKNSPEYIQATQNLLAASQIVGVLASVVADGDVNIGAAVAANATQYNYLTHQKVDEVKSCLSGETCSSQAQKESVVKEAEALSQWLDGEMRAMCSLAPTSDACRTAVNAATQYVAMIDAWEFMNNDVARSSVNTFDYVYNSEGAKSRFGLYYNTIDNRTNFFGASDQYEQNLGLGAGWFKGAEFVSRAPLTGLGADGSGSQFTFGFGALLFPSTYNPFARSDIYQWRDEAGNTLMNAGFDNFRGLFNKAVTDPVAWDINQLRSEQQALQPVHEKYLGDRDAFTFLSTQVTDANKLLIRRLLDDKQAMSGGIDILDYKSRVKFGCKLLGHGAAQGCQP
jgi:filamentous hemagglutinin